MAQKKQNPKIVISEEVKKQLDDLGSKNDSYNDIIKRLLADLKRAKNGGKK